MATNKPLLQRVLLYRLPIFYTFLLSCSFIFLLYKKSTSESLHNANSQDSFLSKQCAVKLNQQQSNDYKFIHPLYLTDLYSESDQYNLVKNDLAQVINRCTASGDLMSACIYFRNMNDGSWFSINANEGYHPGSLFKIPIMIGILKMAEYNPTLLNKEIFFNQTYSNLPEQSFPDKTIELGKKYTVRDLLYHMIVYSDNLATILLSYNINPDIFNKTFTDIGIAAPPTANENYKISASDYSRFMRILYSASYLNKENSEFALSLLSQAKYSDGIIAGLPANTLAAHKFGEAGLNGARELHESAIVYAGTQTYLVTIMSSGKEIHRLAEIEKEMSSIIFKSNVTPDKHS